MFGGGSAMFLAEVFGFGIIAGTLSCAILEVPLLAGLLGTDSYRNALKKILVFVAGLMISYSVIGVMFDSVSRWLSRFQLVSTSLYMCIGIIALIWGLWIVCCGTTSGQGSCPPRTFSPKSMVGFFALGLAVAWIETPTCPGCGPIMLLISMSTYAAGKTGLGILAFGVYSVGQAVPVIALTLGVVGVNTIPKIHAVRPWFMCLIGNLLVTTGLLYLWLA
ncbi:hypothetical protein EB093_01775 [bacterium]|nr:hypothetical protein [bacterium]